MVTPEDVQAQRILGRFLKGPRSIADFAFRMANHGAHPVANENGQQLLLI